MAILKSDTTIGGINILEKLKTFLPLSGGTITGNLTLKGSGNYGTKINFGDGDNVHLSEPSDDVLEIKAKSIRFETMTTASAKPMPVNQGGTGVTSLDALKTALGIGDPATMLGVSKVLNKNSWADIAKISEMGLGAACWSVGDTKSVLINGTIGTLTVNATYWAFILGFNHNSAIEGNGITFGGFKTAQTGGKDVCLVDAKYGTRAVDGTKCFNLSHWGDVNYGGWKGCDMRYDILGSTNKAPSGYGSTATTSRVGYDPENYDIVSNPVANTLMAALPQDLCSVMKPITKYTDNKGNSSNTADGVSASIDYLPLLAEFEIFGTRSYANQYEKNYQKQYAYYVAGNSKVKYRHSSTTSTAWWWERSPYYSYSNPFCYVGTNGDADGDYSYYSYGLAPVFMV